MINNPSVKKCKRKISLGRFLFFSFRFYFFCSFLIAFLGSQICFLTFIFFPLSLCFAQFYISNDAAHDTVLEIGRAGVVEFVDLNPDVNPFHRAYATEIRRCEEMQRILRSFYTQAVAVEVKLNAQTCVSFSREFQWATN
jgi:hypothetical protein